MNMILLPPDPSVCQECATNHPPEHPHDAASLYYATRFQIEQSRVPTWLDAMAHCSQDIQDTWVKELTARGVDVNSTNPCPQ